MIKFDEVDYNDKATLEFISKGGAEDVPILFFNKFNPCPSYKRIKGLTFDDLVVINGMGYNKRDKLREYIFLRNNPSEIRKGPLFEFTKESCGIFVFKEQITNAIRFFTGWEFERADKMRSEMGKHKNQGKKAFVECFKDKKKGEKIYDLLSKSCLNTISKSHSLKITRQMFFFAYCKTHDMKSYWHFLEDFEKHYDGFFELTGKC
jgi:DNA polymerase III alpha subunit